MDHHSGCDHANCNVASSNQSVCQTLSEMDWERSLWNAAFLGEEDKVRKFVERSRNPREIVNAVDNSGYTPLHYAARNGHVEICRILLQHGAFVNAQTRSGKATALHKAAGAGHGQTVQLLLESGACIQMQDADGKTVLHKAAENKHFSLIETLLKICPNLKDMTDFKGKTAVISSES